MAIVSSESTDDASSPLVKAANRPPFQHSTIPLFFLLACG